MSSESALPEWALDGSPGPLAGFKKQFPDHALKQNPNILTLFEKGITTNSRGQTCVLDRAHKALDGPKFFVMRNRIMNVPG